MIAEEAIPYPKGKAEGMEHPIVAVNSGFIALKNEKPITVQTIEADYSIGPVQEILIPTARAALPGFDFKIHPFDGVTLSDAQLAEAMNGLKRADKVVKALKNIRWAFFDTHGYRHALYNYSMANVGNWVMPDVFKHMDAASFGRAPSSLAGSEDFFLDPLLRGVVQDRRDDSIHFYQSQKRGSSPVELDPEQILHIYDEIPGDKSMLGGCQPSIDQWRMSRRDLVLSSGRIGVPNATATIDIQLAQMEHQANEKMGIPAEVWDYLTNLIKAQSTGTAFVMPPGVKLEYPNTPKPNIEIDRYLRAEIAAHLIPTGILDTQGSAISKSSAPQLELFELICAGWREIDALPFEEFYSTILEINGFEASVTLDWWPIVPRDVNSEHTRVVEDWKAHIITVNETRKQLGYPALKPAQIQAMSDESVLIWGSKTGQPSAGGATAPI